MMKKSELRFLVAFETKYGMAEFVSYNTIKLVDTGLIVDISDCAEIDWDKRIKEAIDKDAAIKKKNEDDEEVDHKSLISDSLLSFYVDPSFKTVTIKYKKDKLDGKSETFKNSFCVQNFKEVLHKEGISDILYSCSVKASMRKIYVIKKENNMGDKYMEIQIFDMYELKHLVCADIFIIY